MLVPLVLAIVALALYPQLALTRSEETVGEKVRPAAVIAGNVPAPAPVAAPVPAPLPEVPGP